MHALLTRCPAVTVLATSRERLGVPGEATWKVPPLYLPAPGVVMGELAESDAVTFFCERARATRPTFELDTTNAAAVARICRRLDGIPLALELAAARLLVLSPVQVCDRLEDRFRLLTGRERIAVPHQQTLRATGRLELRAPRAGGTARPRPPSGVPRHLRYRGGRGGDTGRGWSGTVIFWPITSARCHIPDICTVSLPTPRRLPRPAHQRRQAVAVRSVRRNRG